MDTDKLVEQLLRGAALPELLSELPYATAVSVTERLQQEAERYWVIDPRRSLEFADRIVAIGQARADPRQSALGLMARGDALKFMGQEVEAWEAFQLARNMLLAPGEEVGRAQALISSLSQLLAQRHANLQAQARVGAESDSAISLQRLLLRINSRIAHLYKQINDHFQAQARVEAESDSAISLQRLLLRIDLRIANLYKQMGDHLQAVHHYQTAIATAEALGENQYLTSLYMNLGLTYIGLGDAPQALANLERARRTLSITGNQKIETEACHNARKSLKDTLLGRVLESDELHQAEAHVVTCPFCQLRLQLLAMEILMHPEGNCSIWRDRLHDYVEAQLAGHEENPEFMELRRHLDTCVDCAEVYALLYETMWAEQQGAIPELLTMPTLDTSFLSSKAAADPSQHELLDRLPNDYQTDGPSYRMRARSQLNTYMQQNP
ncbi:MAG TPA: tetratricopeptide repeat protein, partial [Anaerolineales bacterium]|nr:tetratricopeptide repeat protein [Anaerolineales bacterium]